MWTPKLWQSSTLEYELRPLRKLIGEEDRLRGSRQDAIRKLAEEMYFDDVRHGGSELDLGMWGPDLYIHEAERLVDGLLSSGRQGATTRPLRG
ncbi:MAG: hypothetical protein HY675_04880 [Chloroflexi bacterium]|nr:hypothetical protein [Chloroflexota bacterium]